MPGPNTDVLELADQTCRLLERATELVEELHAKQDDLQRLIRDLEGLTGDE